MARFKPYLWVVASAVVAALVQAFSLPLEDFLFDARMHLRRDRGWPKDVVLVPIDDAAIGINGTWPWSRAKQAALLRRVSELGAKTIFYDIFLPAKSDSAADDRALAAALGKTVLGVGRPFSKDGRGPDKVPPDALLRAMVPGAATAEESVERLLVPRPEFAAGTAGLGHSILLLDRGSTRFHTPAMYVREIADERVLPSAVLLAFLRQRDADPSKTLFTKDAVALPTGRTLPLHDGGFAYDFAPRGAPAPTLGAGEILSTSADETALRAALSGKLAAVYLDNSYQTTDRPSTVMGPSTAGGYVLATAMRTFEHGASPRQLPVEGMLLVAFAVAFAAAGPLSKRPPNFVLRCGLIAAGVVVSISCVTVVAADVFPPMVGPLALIAMSTGTLTASGVRKMDQERTQLRELLRQSGVDVRMTQGSLVSVAIGPGSADGGARAADGKTVVKKGPPKPLSADAPTRGLDGKPIDQSELLLSGDPLESPVQLGRYEVQRSIGRGGMGAIFLAIDRDLARPVALKILSTADPSAFKRFRQEAMAVARIVHPNVVQIHEVGFDAQVPYLVMEYVPGGTVSDLIRDPEVPLPLPWIRATKIIHCIAKGLGAAHQQGIVHRDIKPSNLLLVRRAGDEAKIADFGIAKLSGGENLTREGSFVGTVGYLSPEQARGKNVDARSDVYSLGITWYKLLTGQSAFEGTTAEVLQQTVHRQHAPDPREYNPDIPLAVVELVTRMTTLEPEGRPKDCNAVAAGMGSILAS